MYLIKNEWQHKFINGPLKFNECWTVSARDWIINDGFIELKSIQWIDVLINIISFRIKAREWN